MTQFRLNSFKEMRAWLGQEIFGYIQPPPVSLPVFCFTEIQDAFIHESPFDSVGICTSYFSLQNAIHQWKFEKNHQIGKEIVSAFGIALGKKREELQGKYGEESVVIAIPSGLNRYLLRMFNPADLLGREAALQLGYPYFSGAYRFWNMGHQSKRKRIDRLKSSPFFFFLRKISGKNVIIIDDVLTTGTTASVFGRTCIRYGAKKVHLIAIAQS